MAARNESERRIGGFVGPPVATRRGDSCSPEGADVTIVSDCNGDTVAAPTGEVAAVPSASTYAEIALPLSRFSVPRSSRRPILFRVGSCQSIGVQASVNDGAKRCGTVCVPATIRSYSCFGEDERGRLCL